MEDRLVLLTEEPFQFILEMDLLSKKKGIKVALDPTAQNNIRSLTLKTGLVDHHRRKIFALHGGSQTVGLRKNISSCKWIDPNSGTSSPVNSNRKR
jgi:hypothetical protein